jgi:hypothetical protein
MLSPCQGYLEVPSGIQFHSLLRAPPLLRERVRLGLLIVMVFLELLTDHRLRCIRLHGFLLSAKDLLFIFGVFVFLSFIADKR